MLMTVALKKLSPLTWKGTPSAISSPESEVGQELCNLLSGTQIDLFGQDLHPVKVFPLLGKEKEKTIADTCGRSSSILLESASLQQSLENKLQQLSDMGGSMIYKMTLKQKATPQQRVYFHLGLSGHRTKGTDSSSQQSAWPTPMSSDNRDRGKFSSPAIQNRVAKGKSIELSMLVESINPWATPTVRDYKCTGNLENYIFGSPTGRVRTDSVPTQAYLITAWPTPQAMDSARGPVRSLQNGQRIDKKGQRFGLSLVTAATLTEEISGLNPQSYTAEMGKTVPSQLNPRFSLWLMGYPIEWAFSGEQVTRSSPKRQQK
jgi:hypothetical protein